MAIYTNCMTLTTDPLIKIMNVYTMLAVFSYNNGLCGHNCEIMITGTCGCGNTEGVQVMLGKKMMIVTEKSYIEIIRKQYQLFSHARQEMKLESTYCAIVRLEYRRSAITKMIFSLNYLKQWSAGNIRIADLIRLSMCTS